MSWDRRCLRSSAEPGVQQTLCDTSLSAGWDSSTLGAARGSSLHLSPWRLAHVVGYDGVAIVAGPPGIAPPDRSTVLQRMEAARHTMLRIRAARAVRGRASGCHVALVVCRISTAAVGIEAMHPLQAVLVVPASRRYSRVHDAHAECAVLFGGMRAGVEPGVRLGPYPEVSDIVDGA